MLLKLSSALTLSVPMTLEMPSRMTLTEESGSIHRISEVLSRSSVSLRYERLRLMSVPPEVRKSSLREAECEVLR